MNATWRNNRNPAGFDNFSEHAQIERAMSSAPKKKWACPSCSYENYASVATCVMCDTKKDGGSSPAAAEVEPSMSAPKKSSSSSTSSASSSTKSGTPTKPKLEIKASPSASTSSSKKKSLDSGGDDWAVFDKAAPV